VNFNWLDVLLGLILAVSVIGGLRKGIARTGIGFAAVIAGLLCGLWFYGTAGAFVHTFVSSRALANLLGFLAIFAIILVLGGLIGALLDKLLKFVHLSWLNRLLGGAFGAVRGILICTVVVFVLMAFSAKPPPRSVAHSRIAPYVMGAARVMAYAAPRDVQEGFHRSYEKLRQAWAEMFEKKHGKLDVDEL
jgi:membrane protein required for colicin V production